MKKEVELDFTYEEKTEIINNLTVDELFDIINSNTGSHVKGFDKKEIIERVLDDNPEYLIDANKIDKIIEQLPDINNCKTVVEALAVQELNNLF